MTSNSPCASPSVVASPHIQIATNIVPVAPLLTATGNCLGNDTLVLRRTVDDVHINWYNNGVLVNTQSQSISTAAGGNGMGSAANQFSYPEGIYMDGVGNIYVADEGNSRILKFPAGSTSATNGVTVAGGNGIGSAANQLNSPNWVYLDASGNIYVADAGNNRIQKFPPNSTSATNGTTVAGGNGAGAAANQLSYPVSVCVSAGGTLYVADQGNQRIQKFPAGSTSATNGTTAAGGNGYGSAANQFADIAGICMDGAGNLYVSDINNHRIQKFPAGSTSATSATTVAGGNGQGSNANQLRQPVAVYVDASGAVYVADIGNSRIQKFPAGGTSASSAVTVAGGNGNGSAANQFSGTEAVFLDASHNIYVSDIFNQRIQKWSALPLDSVYVPASVGSYTAVSTASYGCVSAVSDTIIVGTCQPDTVWPGDADANRIVDNLDLLTIGLGYDSTGPVRTVQGIVWQADPATAWNHNFTIYAPAVNFNNADCNGDGTINADDTLAIVTNFGLVHAKSNAYIDQWRSGLPALKLSITPDTVLNGQLVTTNLYLGDSALPVSNIYGLAFTLHYDATVVDSTTASFRFVPSWLGSSTNSINIHKQFNALGEVKAAITGIDHLRRSGSGLIAIFTGSITTSNINGKDLSYYTNRNYISDVTAIDQYGNAVPLNAGVDSNYVGYYANGINEVAAAHVSIYPNPAAGRVQISSTADISLVSVSDMLGREVLGIKANGKNMALDTESLSSGVYTIRVTTTAGVVSSRLVLDK
jgi:sugar lactone lactonase YvrE